MSAPTLISLPYSPWSFKARWALGHHAIAYKSSIYLPMLGEPWLRLQTKRWRGPVTVPAWIEERLTLMDSLEIARRADALGGATPLFPDGQGEAIDAWNARSEALLRAGRVLTTYAVAGDRRALMESVPPPFGSVAPIAQLFGALGVRFLKRKYEMTEQLSHERDSLRRGLSELREALAGRDHLLGDDLTYADITMTAVLHFVAPPEPPYLKLGGPRSRVHWTKEELADEFSDLVEWRDRLLARHHPRSPRS
ncbi:MAG: glutathione S-transferase family protein [Nannocystaceae bacterium]